MNHSLPGAHRPGAGTIGTWCMEYERMKVTIDIRECDTPDASKPQAQPNKHRWTMESAAVRCICGVGNGAAGYDGEILRVTGKFTIKGEKFKNLVGVVPPKHRAATVGDSFQMKLYPAVDQESGGIV